MTAAGWSVSVLLFLLGAAGGAEPSSGYCIGSACFSLFRAPNTFTSAQDLCGDRGGHLMTVRSTVSNDVLSVLLGNLSGSFWIGLNRLSGCPDPAEALRGFRWVTKDTETDFTNWPPDADSSCSAARCVTVSRDGKLSWSQTPCGQRAVGFLCESSFQDACDAPPCGAAEAARYWTPYGFEVEDMQTSSLPTGTVATCFPSETKHICASLEWKRAPWACEIKGGGCEHGCTVDSSNAPTCYCPPGEAVDPGDGVSCRAAGADDACAALRCEQFCYLDGSRSRCGCQAGLQLAADGRSCADLDECAYARQCPEENFRCVNTPAGFVCVCEAGYRLKGGACLDTDECARAPCEHECTNTPGSYVCSCYEGYRVDEAAPDKCRLHCGREECPAVCDPNDRLQCFCPEGYVAEERESGTVCADIDECDSFACDHACQNTFGGHVCSCRVGFKLVDEYKCVEKGDDVTDPPSESIPASPAVPEPTRRPSALTAGGLVGVIVSAVFLLVLAVFAAHLALVRRGKKESDALKGAEEVEVEEESHGLQRLSASHRDKAGVETLR